MTAGSGSSAYPPADTTSSRLEHAGFLAGALLELGAVLVIPPALVIALIVAIAFEVLR